ncbi:MAG: 2-succinyl-5-enolpyruvyl-6-hydroxy-3-cyclohexene-1-carboxylic-acid synthase [Muribaculaceae bacterium]
MTTEDMMTTDHEACAELVEVLVGQGVKHAVISPGSRNAPLIVAFAREKRIEKHVIVDERSAAFVAVGIAQSTGEPVAVVCTSGSAVLNYAPAAAEAYYRQLPLIFISADRQAEWIDQNDSQTIRQPGVLGSVVKHSCNIPWVTDSPNTAWWINRMVNEAAIMALRAPMGPVHINVQLGEPLCGTQLRKFGGARIIENVEVMHHPRFDIVDDCIDAICSTKRVMIVAGVMPYDMELENVLRHLSLRNNVVVLTETISNIAGDRIITTIDRTLTAILEGQEADFAPDLLITMGGALVTRMLKNFLRSNPAMEEWRIGIDHNVIDTMQHLTKRFEVEPGEFFSQLYAGIVLEHGKKTKSRYADMWRDARKMACECHKSYIAAAQWCDLKAFAQLLPMIPEGTDLHLSNGTSIRYAQLFETPQVHRSYCNRGVAGIDGSTSTALGSSIVMRDRLTLLITGDMSLSYDISGLASQYYNLPGFKIVVMCNGGGGIFRFIKGPSELEELEQYFEVNRDLPVQKYAEAFGFGYYEARDEKELETAAHDFFGDTRAAILAIATPNTLNADVLRGYFAAIRQKSDEK